MQVAGHRGSSLLDLTATGARVSNAYPTCPLLRNSFLKGKVMPDVLEWPPGRSSKGFQPVRDGDAFH